MSRPAILYALAVLSLLPALARADVIHLKNGGTISGEIVAQDGGEVRVKVAGGAILTIERARIERIEKAADPRTEYARRAADLAPDDAEGHEALAAFCREHGLRDEAIQELRRSLAARPDHAATLAALREMIEPQARGTLLRADALRSDRRIPEALEAYREILERYPETASATTARLRIARIALDGGDAAEARRWILPVLAADPGDRDALEIQELAALAEGDYAAAHEIATRLDAGRQLWIRRIQELDPAVLPGPVFARVEILLRLESPAGARREAARLLEAEAAGTPLEPADRARAHRIVADAEVGLGRPAEALAVLRRALATELPEAARAEFAGRVRRFEAIARYGPAAQDAPPETIVRLEEEIDAYLSTPDEARRKSALAAIEPIARERRALFEAVLVHGARLPADAPRGSSKAKLTLPGDLGEAEYVRFVPADYTPERAWPLVIELHGQGGSGEWAADLVDDEAARRGWLVAAPSADVQKGLGFSTYGVELVLATIRDMARTYRVDPDRVVLDGVSMGGHATFAVAGLAADRFAGLVCRSGSGQNFFALGWTAGNLLHVPAYIVHGEDDLLVKPASAQGTARLLASAGVEHVFRLLPDKGHVDFPEENPAIFDWLADRVRPRYPERFEKVMADGRYGRAYWIRVDEIYTQGASAKVDLRTMKGDTIETLRIQRSPATVVAERTRANRLEVRTNRVSRLTVLLTDELVDLDRDVTVHVDAKTRFSGKVERSVEYALEHCRREGERDRVYWGEIRIKLR